MKGELRELFQGYFWPKKKHVRIARPVEHKLNKKNIFFSFFRTKYFPNFRLFQMVHRIGSGLPELLDRLRTLCCRTCCSQRHRLDHCTADTRSALKNISKKKLRDFFSPTDAFCVLTISFHRLVRVLNFTIGIVFLASFNASARTNVLAFDE